VVSVTLGVATLIVVNSVMGGFATEMRDRIRGVLADIIIEGGGFNGFDGLAEFMEQIQQACGHKIEAMTPVVETFALLNYNVMGRTITQPVHVIGVDPQGRAAVSRFAEYLIDPRNQDRPSFEIRDDLRRQMEPWRAWEKSSESSPSPGFGPKLNRGEGWGEGETPEDRQGSRPNAVREVTGRTRSAEGAEEASSIGQSPSVRLGLPVAQSVTGSGARALLPSPSSRSTAEDVSPIRTASFDSDDPTRTPDASDPPAQASDPLLSFEDNPQTTERGIIVPWLLASFRSHDKDIEVIRPGDQVLLTLAGTSVSALRPEGRLVQFTVVDRFKSGMSEYDQSQCFVSLKDMQEIRGMGQRVTGIYIKLKNYADNKEVVTRLERIFHPPLFRVLTWEDKQGPLLAAVSVEQGILNVLLFMIIAVAGFGILAIFFMIVVEKTRDIGVLKSLGASDRGVQGIFLGYGLSLGLVGSGLGMGIGLLITIYLDNIEKFLSRLTGHDLFDRNLYYFDKIPTVISPLNISWIVCGALLIALAASVLPARRAAALRPVEALRYE
jgi:lipoprotein-releasing system permease protein